MRNLAPAFILTSIVALASGSALALGDMNKSRKGPSAESTSQVTTPASSPSYTTPSSAPNAPSSSYTSSTTPSTSSDNTSKPNASVGANGSVSATTAPMGTTADSMDSMPLDKDKSGLKSKQTAPNDGRCDASKYPNRNDVPKDCPEKSGTGAAAVSSTQGQSGK